MSTPPRDVNVDEKVFYEVLKLRFRSQIDLTTDLYSLFAYPGLHVTTAYSTHNSVATTYIVLNVSLLNKILFLVLDNCLSSRKLLSCEKLCHNTVIITMSSICPSCKKVVYFGKGYLLFFVCLYHNIILLN